MGTSCLTRVSARETSVSILALVSFEAGFLHHRSAAWHHDVGVQPQDLSEQRSPSDDAPTIRMVGLGRVRAEQIAHCEHFQIREAHHRIAIGPGATEMHELCFDAAPAQGVLLIEGDRWQAGRSRPRSRLQGHPQCRLVMPRSV